MKTILRKNLRAKRRNLSTSEQLDAAKNLALQFELFQLPAPLSVAAYSASDGEIDPINLVLNCMEKDYSVALPCIDSSELNNMSFAPVSKSSITENGMHKNRFGILEPDTDQRVKPDQFDLVLLPLVGFDKTGNRLGMGGGFYDRTFQFKRASPCRKPFLIGLAHDCQEVEALETESWDIPLDAILTDRRYIQIRPIQFG